MNHILLKDFNRGYYCIRSESLEQWIAMATILSEHGFRWNNEESLLELTQSSPVEIHIELGNFKIRFSSVLGWYQRSDYCKYCLDVKTFAELYKTNLVPQYGRLTL